MKTEVFVSLDGLNFEKIDLDKGQSIPLRLTMKDTQDISKIFSPYSLGFTFKCTPKNLKALGYFGNTNIIRSDEKIRCKIYVNSILFQNGLLKLERIVYKGNAPETITASFATTMTNLRDRFGDDTIRDLGRVDVSFRPDNVRARVGSIQTLNVEGISIRWYVPFASIRRVWDADNLTFANNTNPTSEKLIKSDELRPAVNVVALLNMIKRKYNLNIISPIEERSEVRDAFIWCMGDQFGNSNVFKPFVQKTALSAMGSFPRKYNISMNLSTQIYTIAIDPTAPQFVNYTNSVELRIAFQNINNQGQSATIALTKIGENQFFRTATGIANGNNLEVLIQIPDAEFFNNQIQFTVSVNFSAPTLWTNSTVRFIQRILIIGGTFVVQSLTNNNSVEMGATNVDLIGSLPNIKVIDFIQSYFRAFNIAALDVSPDNDSLFWYTPDDVEANKSTVTYVAEPNFDKSLQDEFDFFIFKHADSEFRSNIDYAIGAGVAYGRTNFPEIKPQSAKEFSVETNFTIIPPVEMLGASDISTFYGFSDVGEPRFGELVWFYSHGNHPLNRFLGFQSSNGSALINSSIDSYVRSLPFTLDGKSFAFSILVWQNQPYRNNLFSRNYAKIIARYVNPNVLKQDFTLTLSANEMRDFRLQNDVIIGEDKFTIIDSTIDITTGKTKLTLLNYAR